MSGKGSLQILNVLGRARLGEKTMCAPLICLLRFLVFVSARKDDYQKRFQFGTFTEPFEHLVAINPRHFQIQQKH